MNNQNMSSDIDRMKRAKEYYVKEIEKSDETLNELMENGKADCMTLTAGVLCLGAMISNSTNMFASDGINPLFGVGALVSGILSLGLTYNGLKSLVPLISTLAAYINTVGNIKGKIALLETELQNAENEMKSSNNNRGMRL